MRINHAVSSATAHMGDSIEFKTLDKVRLGNLIVIPKGTTAIGHITEVVPQREMLSGSRLEISIEYVRLRSGEMLVVFGMLGFLSLTCADTSVLKGHEVTVVTTFDYDLTNPKHPVALPASDSDY